MKKKSLNLRKKISLSEFCYALGVKVLDSCSEILGKNHKEALKNEDMANELGYATIASVLGVKNSELSRIPDSYEYFKQYDNLLKLFDEISIIYKDINNAIVKCYTFPGKDKKVIFKYSGFQFISYFASLWVKKYGTSTSLSLDINPKYQTEYKKILYNIPYYYIYDMLRKKWSASGDSKLSDVYMNNSIPYLEKIDYDSFEQVITDWNKEMLMSKSVNVSSEVKIFQTFFYNIIGTTFENESYDFEHIVPRKILGKFPDSLNVSGGSVGNICIMYSRDNRSKHDKTIYQLKSKSELTGINIDRVEDLFYPSEKDLMFLNNIDDVSETAVQANKFIEMRSQHLINRLIIKLKDCYISQY